MHQGDKLIRTGNSTTHGGPLDRRSRAGIEREAASGIGRSDRFRAVFEGALDAIFVVDDDGVYVEANPAACTLLGREHDAIVGRQIKEIGATGMDEGLWSDFPRDGRKRGECRFVKPDGAIRQVEYTATARIRPGLHVAVVRDVTELRRAERTRLSDVSRRLLDAHETERRMIACELHDQIGQILTGLRITLDTESRGGVLVDKNAARVLVDELASRVRELLLDLRPPMLDDLGLIPALHWHITRYAQQTGVQVRFHHSGVHERLRGRLEITVFRIVQEALTNVARHAETRRASVDLRRESATLVLRVEDEGNGFDPRARRIPSTGVPGMRERAELAGGTFLLDSEPGGGARLVARLPIEGAQ